MKTIKLLLEENDWFWRFKLIRKYLKGSWYKVLESYRQGDDIEWQREFKQRIGNRLLIEEHYYI
jgi:hypothetical protein